MTTATNNREHVSAPDASRGDASAAIHIIPGESMAEWAAHCASVAVSFSPVGEVETLLAQRIANILWRLNRLARYEVELTAAGIEETTNPLPSGFDTDLDSFSFGKKATPEQAKVKAERDKRKLLIERTMLDEGTLAKIAQWERHLSKELMRTLKHLQSVRSLRG
jgi:hypothetical protein